MNKDLIFYRLNKGQTISLREVFKLEDCDDIKLIVVKIHDDYDGMVEIKIGEEEPKIVDKNRGFTWGFGHLIGTSLNVRTGVVEGTITALEDSVISLGVTLL